MNTRTAPHAPRGQFSSVLWKRALVVAIAALTVAVEIYGLQFGYVRWMGAGIVTIAILVGLDGFSTSYNEIHHAPASDRSRTKARIKFAAEKAAAIGVLSLTAGVAMGLYNFDAINEEANTTKLVVAQRQLLAAAQQTGCRFDKTDQKDCVAFHDALNKLWTAVMSSNVRAISNAVFDAKLRWIILGGRLSRESRDRFDSIGNELDKLDYAQDINRQSITLLLAIALIPFSVAATSRKLAVAAFEADFNNGPVSWRLIVTRLTASVFGFVVSLGSQLRRAPCLAKSGSSSTCIAPEVIEAQRSPDCIKGEQRPNNDKQHRSADRLNH